MTGTIIFLCILGIILFILFMPAVVDFRYEDSKTAVKVSYCGITVFDSTKKKPEKTPEEKKAAISAFIEAKRRQVKYNNTQQTPAFGQSQTPINQDMESETKDANYYKNKYGF